MLRRRSLAVLAAAMLLAPATTAISVRADDGNNHGIGSSTDNSAVAVNTTNGKTVFDLAFSVTQIAGPVVAPTNTAIAYSNCTSCTTIAIAIQIVLASGDPTTVTPQNVAVALNVACTLCNTLADAYQFVIAGGQPLQFTDEGREAIVRIRRSLEKLRNTELSLADLQARIDGLVQQLRQVIATDLVPAKPSDEGEGQHQNEQQSRSSSTASGDQSPSSSTSTRSSSSPSATSTSSPVTSTTTTP